jgi:hypothetical protein
MKTLTKPVQADRSKIDMQSTAQVKAWAKNLDISPAELARVVDTVGNSAAQVRRELDRSDR